MTSRFRQISGAMLVTALLSGCGTTPATRQETGSAAGSQPGTGHARPAAVIVGPAAAGSIRARQGRLLDEEDRRNITRATERALATHTPQRYTSPDTGVKVTITPQGAPAYDHTLRMQVRVAPGVVTSLPLRADRRTVFAMTDMELRAAPKLTSKTTRLYRRWERAEVIAAVPNSQYRLISIGGVAVGYAREVYLAARKEDVPPPRHASANAAPAKLRKSAGTPRTLILKSECKRVRRTIELPNGKAESEVMKFCKEPPSAWRQVT